TLERIDIGDGDTALEMALDVLQVLRHLAVDIARQVQVVVVLLDLLKADHARVAGHLKLPGEDIHDLVNVLCAEPILGAVLHESLACVDHEDALAGVGVLLVNNDNTGGNTGAVKEIGGQSYDSLDVPLTHESPANVGFGVAPE